ncbi:NUDIX domain-containing protein [Patescibacteria group bacterium]|nr:NUDIX domain-containing protein [Patescibacteria group bacterium]MBU3922727.1 NUDIX domain-containing protein [Patescibacteria group bacterium]
MSKRVCAIIIKNNKILLMRRIRRGQEYFVFPGGGVERGESIKDAMVREVKEELSLSAKLNKSFFQIENQGQQEFYFLIKNFSGILKLGGEEKERMNKNNQYYPIWIDLNKILKLSNLYPIEARQKVVNLFKK